MFSKTYTLIIYYISVPYPVQKGQHTGNLSIRHTGQSHDLRRTFPEMHRHKDTGPYPVDELLGTSHKIGP